MTEKQRSSRLDDSFAILRGISVSEWDETQLKTLTIRKHAISAMCPAMARRRPEMPRLEKTGMIMPSIWQLSQSHLNQLTQCPRRFQYRYLDQWGLSTVDKQQTQQTLGAQFHHLIEQQALGLDIQPFLKVNPQLQEWFLALQASPPPFITGECRHEHQQLLSRQSVTLVAVYDRLIQNSQQAQILDWKTYTRPHNLNALRRDWQTRLYPYILVETSEFAPEQILMVYWFAQVRANTSHSLVLNYDSKQHQQTDQDLTAILKQFTKGIEAYERGQSWPQVPIADGQCEGRHPCPFLSRCRPVEALPEYPVDLDAIAEVPI